MKSSQLYIENNKSIGELFVLNSKIVCKLSTLEGRIEELQFLIDMYNNTKKRCKTLNVLSMLDIFTEDLEDRKKIIKNLLEEVKIIHQIQ